jgi:hypothetical protein
MPHGDIASDCYWSILPSLLEPPEWSADSAGKMTGKVFGPAAPTQQYTRGEMAQLRPRIYALPPLFSANIVGCCGRTSGSWPRHHLSQNNTRQVV